MQQTIHQWVNKPLYAYALLAICLAVSLGLYHESLEFGYVLDDIIVYTENSFVQKGFSGIWDILSKESFTGYFGEQKDLVAGARYRPLSLVSFAIEFGVFGNKPAWSHLINILLYGLTGYVLFCFLKTLLQIKLNVQVASIVGSLSALLFLSHPIHSEAVANIKGRDEIMCLLFCLISAYQWLRFVDTGKRLHQIGSCWWFMLALFSKENAITFLAVIPLSVYFFRNQNFTSSLRKAWPLFVVAVAFIIIRRLVIGYFLSSGAVITDLMNNPFIYMNSQEKTATLFYTFIWYYKLLFFPHPLTHDYYPYHVPKVNWTDVIPWISLVINLGLLYVVYRTKNRNPLIAYSLTFYLVTFSIVSNVVFPVGTFMNERFLFMPSVAFSLLSAYALYLISNTFLSIGKYLAAVIFLILFSGYSIKTITRVPDWKDGFTLNLSAVKVSKNSARINLFTGVSYFQKSQSETNPENSKKFLQIAEHYIDRSLQIFPQYGQALNMKAGVLSEWLKRDNDVHTFLSKLESVIKIKPDLDFVTKYMEYLVKDPENFSIMFPYFKRVGYEILYKEVHNYSYALHFLGMAYNLKKEDAELCYSISKVYADFAKFGKVSAAKIQEYENKAKDFYQQAATLDPKYAQ